MQVLVDFSSLSRSSALGRMLRGVLKLVPHGLIMPVWQGALRGARWIVGSATHGCWLGSYESEKQRRFASSIGQGATVMDVGANVGFYTLIASRQVGSQGRVVAIEPNERNLTFLRRHVAMNACAQVSIVAAAAGRMDGSTHFTQGTNPSMGHVSVDGAELVSLRSLDSLKKELRLGRVEVMKIDVEGFELDVLEGAATILSEDKPTIFLATHGMEISRRCRHHLQRRGYAVAPIMAAISTTDADEFIAIPRDSVA